MADGSVFARVHVLVLCDVVRRRPDEEAVFELHGVRTHVRARAFPYTHPQLSVYLQVTGHQGPASGRVVVLREASEEEIAHAPIDEVQLQGPLTVLHLRLRISDCEFPASGVYWFQVFLNEKLVAERRFFASEIPGDTNGQPIS
jgi:hypothetical protein